MKHRYPEYKNDIRIFLLVVYLPMIKPQSGASFTDVSFFTPAAIRLLGDDDITRDFPAGQADPAPITVMMTSLEKITRYI